MLDKNSKPLLKKNPLSPLGLGKTTKNSKQTKESLKVPDGAPIGMET